MVSESLTLHLPPYPCQRARVANGRAYYAPAYERWKRQAKADLQKLWTGKDTLTQVKKLSIQFYGWNRKSDLSNLFKAVEDAMVAASVIREDNLTVITHIETAWEKASTKQSQFIEILLEW